MNTAFNSSYYLQNCKYSQSIYIIYFIYLFSSQKSFESVN